jgi:hypothetical protein
MLEIVRPPRLSMPLGCPVLPEEAAAELEAQREGVTNSFDDTGAADEEGM